MRHLAGLFLFLLLFTSTGCYHAKVTTGETPGTVVIHKPFALGWIYGLVPPKTVQAASECQNGVAIVETKLSFLNQVASMITFGLFTPMHITVTYAASGMTSSSGENADVVVAYGSSTEEIVDAFSVAADQAVATEQPVLVRIQ